jgi:CRP/FNR family transcriptional regulator, cyclic AMP receptor protein
MDWPMPEAAIRLLDADPDLGALLPVERRLRARGELVAHTRRLAVGEHDLSRLAGETSEDVGLLILEGIVARALALEGRSSLELLGPGDLVRPGRPADRAELLALEAAWVVRSPLSVALLDRRFAVALARYPEVTAALFDRLTERSQRLAIAQAISQLTGVDRRLKALLWHLSERWGRVAREGVILPLALNHVLLGELIGARRPTVSTALADLAARGEVVRRADGGWLLTGDPPDREALRRGGAAEVAVGA